MIATDERCFLARIAANPADDTDRLVYADWLDEHADVCSWGGIGGTFANPVIDVGRTPRARAEFIRLQCFLSQHPPAVEGPTPGSDEFVLWRKGKAHQIRESALLAAHASDWRRAGVCEKCKGGNYWVENKRGETVRGTCPHCWGGDVGGLLRAFHRPPFPESAVVLAQPARLDFARGFPQRIHCSLSDVIREVADHDHNDRGHKPAPWALAVVRHHPVTAFRVDVPFGRGHNSWFIGDIPDFLFNLILQHDNSTPDAAHTAMALALGAWVRSFAYPKETA